MNSFHVLDRNQNIHQSYLLEASAGTGKTFSIENIVVRLLIEGKEPLSIDKMLVVTFTKAATRDLKIRIRSAIETSLSCLNKACLDAHDYLRAIIENGPSSIDEAKKRLENALFCFDQAQIFTIHGFCFRMLRQHTFEGDFSLDALRSEESVSDEELLKLVRDFFRSKLRGEVCHPVQLEILLNKHRELDQVLLRTLKEGYEIYPGPTYVQSFERFQQAMQQFKKLDPDKIVADYEKQLPFYKKVDFGDSLFNIQSFAQLFQLDILSPKHLNELIKNKCYYYHKFHPGNVNKTKKNVPRGTDLHYPQFFADFAQTIWPVIRDACSYDMIYSRVAYECQEMVKTYLRENEKMFFGDFLESMAEALQQPLFCAQVQSKYQAAIIDEFQDTDPVQWEIFKRLFLDGNKFLYLVGDPKQSIYAFRRADIYTYRDAALSLSPESHSCLDTNYRSQPSLILALNQLFQSAQKFIELPRTQTVVDFQPVKSAPRAKDKQFADDRGSLHFMISESKDAETKEIFPYVLNEIRHLNRQGIAFKDIAILVKDRNQSERFSLLANQYGLPVALQKRGLLSESPLVANLQEILQAVLHPRNQSNIKKALGGGLIGWDHIQVKGLSDLFELEKVMAKFYALRGRLMDEGFSSFYFLFLDTRWHAHELTTRELLLCQQGGSELLDELDQIATLLMDHQGKTHCIPEALIKFLNDMRKLETQGEDSIKIETDSQRDAVQVLSMHSSKGLEFDVVFALGVSANLNPPKTLIPVPRGTKQLLKAVEEDSAEYVAYCRENDAEKMRQLYVAFTRAKSRLYVPAILHEKSKSNIMKLFLEKLEIFSTSSLQNFVAKHKPQMNFTLLTSDITVEPIQAASSQPELIEPKQIAIPGIQRFMLSYTSMTKRFATEIVPKEIVKPPRLFDVPEKTPHLLPAGAETGIMLHKIFENIPLDCCKNTSQAKELAFLIKPYLKNTQYETWLDVCCEIVYSTLTTSLGNFSLTDINPEKCYREIEFLYPTDTGFMKGVIDLVFEHGGRHYIVDWKSNWLGVSNDAYTQEKMRQAMAEHDYYLQKDLYIQAWKRYLRINDDRSFEECFGGVYYFFVRGVSAKTGIF